VRVLGMVAASLAVVVCTALAARVAGRRAALPAALLAAVLFSSPLLDSVFTPAELLASVPSALSVLLLLWGLGRDERAWLPLAGAGAAAAAALLVKQSFGDALVAGAAGLAIAAWHVPWRRTATRVGAYAAGVGCVALALIAWESLAHTAPRSPDSVRYALIGFRLVRLGFVAFGDEALREVVVAGQCGALLLGAPCDLGAVHGCRPRHDGAADHAKGRDEGGVHATSKTRSRGRVRTPRQGRAVCGWPASRTGT